MWHEARKQERKIRGMMVDYRRRAERRRDFYERIKADPTQFLQLHGRQCKIHLDPAVASSANSPAAMMPWQGQKDNLIDRFDVRAHLDFIPPVNEQEEDELTYEERQINYERYRIIAQNSFLCISEEKFLKQLHLEEQFGYTEPESKKKKPTGAAIGFNYEDGTGISASGGNSEDNSDDNSDSDLDVDLYINVSKVDQHQAHELNKHGLGFGMSSNDFYSFLTDDMEEAESNRLAREEEHEKALFSGRKSRRERRAHREKRLANRVISPPSYAARSSPTYPSFRDSKSASHSPSPENSGKITYITSFGGDDEIPTTSAGNGDKIKSGNKYKRHLDTSHSRRTNSSRRRSRSAGRHYKRRRRSRSSTSRSPRSRHQSRSRKSRSYDRYRRSSRSVERSRKYRSRRSTSSSSSSRSSSSSSSGSSSRRSRSRSRNNKTRNWMTSSSRSSSSSKSKRSSPIKKSVKSRSPSVQRESPPKLTVQRYYGRKRSDYSSSDLEDLSDTEEKSKMENNQAPFESKSNNSGNAVSTFKKSIPIINTSSSVMSLQERLKRKRQALLNKQFKADKLAEQLKSEREKQEQQNREDELREMAIKLRRRQREIRHAYDSNTSNSSSDSDERKSNASPRGNVRSQSDSPSDKRSAQESPKVREPKIRERSRERTEWRERDFRSERRSPKSGECERRSSYYKEERSGSSSNNYRREIKRDDYKRDSRDYRSSRREDHKGSRSLVDY